MKTAGILDTALDTIRAEYGRLGLRPGCIARFGLKPGWNAVIGTDGSCGIAMSFGGNNPRYGDDETNFDTGELKPHIGDSMLDFAEKYLGGGTIRKRSMAVAALNALSRPLVEDHIMKAKGYDTAADPSHLVSQDDIVAIVGYGGLVKTYIGRCRELHVTDQRPVSSFVTTMVGETIEQWPDNVHVHSEKENEAVLSRADIVFITGSALVNGTFDELMLYSKRARLRCLYGSSAQLVPDALFASGVDIVMSVAVTDPRQFEEDVMHASDMEGALKSRQRKYTVSRRKLD